MAIKEHLNPTETLGHDCRLGARFWAILAAMCLALLFWAADPAGRLVNGGGVALADDGDGGGDNGGGDNGGGDNGGGSSAGGRGSGEAGGRGGRGASGGRPGFFNIFRSNRRGRNRRRARRSAPIVVRAPDELVVTGLTQEQAAALVARGFEVLDRQSIEALAGEVILFKIRRGISLNAARAEVAGVSPFVQADFNHFYRPGERSGAQRPIPKCSGHGCVAKNLIGWPAQIDPSGPCGKPVRIGLIDTGINPTHRAFQGGQLRLLDVPLRGGRKSSARHGTAVAALLIGSSESRAPGLLPGATLIAVDAFTRARRNSERSDAFTLVRSLDLLARQEVSIINMSLSGPSNLLLQLTIAALNMQGVVMVAAAGNNGPRAKPVYPAAYAGVIAVTAVDRNRRVYRRAGRGAHVDLAAPGVRVWTAASVRGARPKTGTSFAVPFVTAAAVMAQQGSGARTADEVLAVLADLAVDLGKKGKDPVFGHGLLQVAALCAPRVR